MAPVAVRANCEPTSDAALPSVPSGAPDAAGAGIVAGVDRAALAVEHALAYNVLVLEDPDVVWDGGKDAEELYLALRREFDLEDRVKIIREKVSIIARSSTFIISRLEAQRSQLLEWGIILLIVGEIVLVLLGKF